MITVELENQNIAIIETAIPLVSLISRTSVKNTFDCPIVVGRLDGTLVDLSTKLTPRRKPYRVELLNTETTEGMQVFWHSTCHLMTQAKLRISPGTFLGVGPAIADGFYQDFAIPINESELEAIEQQMHRIVDEALPIERRVITRAEAMRIFSEDPFKTELIKDFSEDDIITTYIQGEHTDLCRGVHVPNTSVIGHNFRLLRCSGAYWRGDANREQLTRIYGVSFPSDARLKMDLRRRDEAQQRDHRKIGNEMELFTFTPDAPGSPVFLPDGTELYNTLVDYKRELMRKFGYQEIRTPSILKRRLWEESGHWEHYGDKMFTVTADDDAYAVKPMNCPGSAIAFRSRNRSYRELPVRLGEFGFVHRYENSGEITGLLRVRAFTQDDAHLYLRPDQIRDEVVRTIRMYRELYDQFGFSYRVALSTRPEKKIGGEALWDEAESGLRDALDLLEIDYGLKEGDGAFYGPKIDFQIRDCLDREWQCGTIQLDFQMPQRFQLEYIGEDGQPHRPVMIHPATMGSIERFMAILIEEFEGKFPTWLAPVQVLILPISAKSTEHCDRMRDRLIDVGFRAEVDNSNERIGKKVRNAHVKRPAYVLVVGPKEAESNTVSVRDRSDEELRGVPFSVFVDGLALDVVERHLTPFRTEDFRQMTEENND